MILLNVILIVNQPPECSSRWGCSLSFAIDILRVKHRNYGKMLQPDPVKALFEHKFPDKYDVLATFPNRNNILPGPRVPNIFGGVPIRYGILVKMDGDHFRLSWFDVFGLGKSFELEPRRCEANIRESDIQLNNLGTCERPVVRDLDLDRK